MKYSLFFLSYLPIVLLLIFTFVKRRKRQVSPMPLSVVALLELCLVIYIAFYPPELTADKMDYYYRFLNIDQTYDISEYKDPGWMIYMRLCHLLTFGNVYVFFIITASIYVLSYYFFAKRYLPKYTIGYFIVMSAGCLGFFNYGTNVIRNGVAIALLFFAVSLKFKLPIRIAIIVAALLIHKSVFIPLFAFFAAFYLKKEKTALYIWLLCLFLSIIEINLEPIFETVGFIDQRIVSYGASINSESSYEKGFRLDFLLYSVAPIIIAFYYKRKKYKINTLYWQVFRAYLLSNSIWLLAIRIAYSDRLAYLSWFMIPFVTLYPVAYEPSRFRNPQIFLLRVMYLFMGVSVALGIRSMLKGTVI